MINREIIHDNRRYWQAMPRWITNEDRRNSRGDYGDLAHALLLLTPALDDQPTYTDLLVDVARRLSAPVCYLELAVSAGKNFYTLANALEQEHRHAIDVVNTLSLVQSDFA